MKTLAAGLRHILTAALLAGAVSALAGFLAAHFGHLGRASQGIGTGLCIGGALLGLVTGQSGSPGRMAVEGRWGPFGQYWGSNPALPESPYWLLASSLLVVGAGIAVVVLTN